MQKLKKKIIYEHSQRTILKMKSVKTVPSTVIVIILLSSGNLWTLVEGGCRDQERVQCESVCHWNSTSNQHDCNLRAVLILPSNLTYEASLTKVFYN